MGAHVLLLKKEVVVGSAASGHPPSGDAELLPDGDEVVTSVLRCSWLCRLRV